jgi:hypothetical protein
MKVSLALISLATRRTRRASSDRLLASAVKGSRVKQHYDRTAAEWLSGVDWITEMIGAVAIAALPWAAVAFA